MTKELVLAAILQATGIQSGTIDAVRVELLAPVVLEESDAFGFDPLLTVAVAQVESGFDPKAVNPTTGALGLMQLLRGGAIPPALDYMSDAALMYPRRNLALGLAYLSRLREKCKHPHGMLSLFDGRGSCRASEYSTNVLRLYRQLKRGAAAGG